MSETKVISEAFCTAISYPKKENLKMPVQP